MSSVISRVDTNSFNKVVSLEAGQAISIFGMSGALVRNGNTNTISILYPSVRANKADSVVPIPSSTAKISRMSSVISRVDTGSILKIITFVAGQTITVVTMSRAVIVDSNTNSVTIENPLVRTSKADQIIPVPIGTSDIRRIGIVGC